MENTRIQEYAGDLFRRYPELLPASESIFQAYSIIENAFFKSKILFICGNGGSAADAEHITGELSKGFLLKRELPADLKSKMNERLGENMDDITCKTGLDGHRHTSKKFEIAKGMQSQVDDTGECECTAL